MKKARDLRKQIGRPMGGRRQACVRGDAPKRSRAYLTVEVSELVTVICLVAFTT